MTSVGPRVKEICDACINRVMRGDSLKVAAIELLEGGDSFRSIVLNPSSTEVIRLKELPPWECFRIENEDGLVEYFEQRKWLDDSQALRIHPAVCVHFRFRRNSLYGRGLFEEMAPDAQSLSKGFDSLDRAVIASGVNPNVHVMPSGTDEAYREQYKRGHEQRVRSGTVMTDYYLMPAQDGGEGTDGNVYKMVDSWNPDVTALLENVTQRRRRFAMQGRIPPYLLGLETGRGKTSAVNRHWLIVDLSTVSEVT